MDTQSYLETIIHDSTLLFVFPNATLRKHWTENLSKHFGCIGLDNFVTFQKFQQLLQIHISQEYNNPIRFLTRNERVLMASKLLQDTKAQTYVYQIEQLYSENKIIDFSTRYSNKLLKMFDRYVVYMSDSNLENQHRRAEFITALQALLVLYDNLLTQYNCIDSAVLTYRLCSIKQNLSSSCTKENMEHLFYSAYNIKLLVPNLLDPIHKIWLEYFGKNGNEGDKNNLFVYEELSSNTHIGSFFYNNESIDRQKEKPILHKYCSVTQELENIFCLISMLLDKGIPPYDIALTVCAQNEQMNAELLSVANKYQVPIFSEEHKYGVVKQFVMLLNEVVYTNFSPPVLKRLLLDGALPWKHRKYNIEIIKIGMEDNCLNDKYLNRWKYLLQSKNIQDEKSMSTYFMELTSSIQKICSSTTFKALYTNIENFVKRFFDLSIRKLGEYESDDNFVNVLLIEIEAIFAFENYLNNIIKDSPPLWIISPWNVIGNILENIFVTHTRSRDMSVQLIPFPNVVSTIFPYQFICNLSQNIIIQKTSFQSIFNDFLSQRYDSNVVVDYYEQYRKCILECISLSNSNIYLSGSELGLDGVHLLPVCWKIVEVEEDELSQDIWNREQLYWKNDGMSALDFPITDQQRLGLIHQQTLQLGKEKSSLIHSKVDNTLYRHILSNQNIVVSATKLHSVFSPISFLFEHILGVKPLMEGWNYGMQEQKNWGSLYHKLLEKYVLAYQTGLDSQKERQFLEYYANDEYKDELLLTLIKKQGIHTYLWNTYLAGLQNFDIESYFNSILTLLDAKKEDMFFAERTMKFTLSELIEILQDGKKKKYKFNTSFIQSVNITGKADLVFTRVDNALSQKDLLGSGVNINQVNKIFDYKYKLKGSYIDRIYLLFQPWIYHLFFNKFLTKNKEGEIDGKSTSLYSSEQQDFLGLIYYISETPGSKKSVYPIIAEPTKQEEKKNATLIALLNVFDNALLIALQRISSLDIGEKELYAMNIEKEQEVMTMLTPKLSFSMQLIVREGCYAYIK